MYVITFVILICLSALFAGAETALFSLRISQVRLMQQKKERNAHIVARLKGDPHRLLVALLFGNTVVNVSVGSLATIMATDASNSVSIGLATGLSTLAVLLLGEIFPTSFAITYNKRVAQFLAYPIFLFYILLYPFATIFVWIEQFIQHKTNSKKHSVVTEEEIRIMSDLGLEQGEIDFRERQMIESIFEFDDIPVGDIMTSKDAIDSLNGEVPVSQIAYYVSQSGFSRFPVYKNNPNDYIGYVHTNDVMRVLNSDNRDELLLHFISSLTRVPETMNLRQVFRLMTRERSHMYLVHKDGDKEEITGLVTMENILEEIMGEIEDEGDKRAMRRPHNDSSKI